MAHNGPRPFLITTPEEQPDEASRTNARRYAMRGKNIGKSRKRLVRKTGPASWINRQFDTELCQDPEPLISGRACTNQIPRQLGSEWSMFQFAGEVSPATLQTFAKFYGILEQSTYPNPVLAGNDLERQAPSWFAYLGQSRAYFHTQLFVITVYSDMIDSGIEYVGPLATQHMTKALGLLRTDLTKINQSIIGATISSIIAFSMVAFIVGDISSAEKHLHGLFKLVTTLGGIRSIRTYGFLQAKSCRLDLSYAMSTWSKPLFFANDNISWGSYLPRSTRGPRTTAIHLLLGDSATDPKLINIWHDLYEFSRAANIATQTGKKLESDLLQEVIISVQYRLLHLKYDNEDTHELLRVVMLVYSIKILPLLFSHFGAAPVSSPSLSNCSRNLLITLDQLSPEKLKALLWLLVIVRTSILDEKLVDFQLSHILEALDLSSWDKILGVLKDFLWIDILHKEQAKALFNDMI